MIVALAGLSMIACNKVQEQAPAEDKAPASDEFTYTIAVDGETKAYLNSDHMTWQLGDVIGWFTDKAGNSEINMGTTPRSFQVSSTAAMDAGTKIYAYAPYKDGDQSATAAPLSIPTTQDGVITDAMPMVSLPISLEDDMAASTDTPIGQARFLGLGAVIEYNVYTSDDTYGTEKVQSVQFASTSNIAGDFTVNLTTVAEDAIPAPTGLDQKTVTSTLATATTVGADKEHGIKVYQVVAPGTWSGTITVTTDIATYSYTITDKEFTRGKVKPFNVNLASANATRSFTISGIETLLTAKRWHISNFYCISGDCNQPAAFEGDAIQFLANHKLAYIDGGVSGFIYCDMNGWNAGYDFSLSENESWEVIYEGGDYYIQFSNGGFPLIAVDATTINCRCKIESLTPSSLQLREKAETWGDDYNIFRITFTTPACPYTHSFAEGDWGVGLENYLGVNMTNPDVLDGASWSWSIINNDNPTYDASGLFMWTEPWSDFWALQIGNYSNVRVSDFILSSNSFSGAIKKVSISFFADKDISVSCNVGGNSFGSTVNIPSGTAIFNGSESGSVSISLHASSTIPIWLTSIAVEYEP